MKTSVNGINLIKQCEGCVNKVYLDAVNVKTVGYGHTGNDVNKLPVGTIVSQEQINTWLVNDLIKFERKVDKYTAKYHFNQNQFDALVSFAFNVGNIDQLTASGTRTINEIAQKILLYNKAGGRVLNGLKKRRQAEHDLFLKPVYPTLKIGSKGEYVVSVQTYLSILGYEVGTIDGIYGTKTATAVKMYQEEKKLKIDGIWGPQCWASVK